MRQRTLLVHLVADGVQPFPVKRWHTRRVESANVIVRAASGSATCDVAGVSVDPARPRVAHRHRRSSRRLFALHARVVRSRRAIRRAGPFRSACSSSVEFSFKVECPTDFDCEPRRDCPPDVDPEPEIDYLAKDYASFRRLMLDRMALLVPAWTERSPADLGVTLVELLAYVGRPPQLPAGRDRDGGLLGTARRRVSVRRHARLVDYAMHDGCNARAWVHIEVIERRRSSSACDLTGTRTRFLTFGGPDRHVNNVALPRVLDEFRPRSSNRSHRCRCLPRTTRLPSTPGARADCCLPKGATRATLRDDHERAVAASAG